MTMFRVEYSHKIEEFGVLNNVEADDAMHAEQVALEMLREDEDLKDIAIESITEAH